MGCFLYDDGEEPARLKIRRQAMKWKHPDSCPKGNYGMPLDGAVCDCGLDEFVKDT